jgi:hypothetical protein
VSDGRRWLALDADMFGKPFTLDLQHRFGWAGIGTWIAFLCACKRSRTPGTVRYLNEADARAQLGILGIDLVDNQGENWSLEDFWLYTGRKKQTRRTRRGREMNITATHWGRWQQDAGKSREAERKRTSRTQKRPGPVRERMDIDWTNGGPDRDKDSDTPQPPKGGSDVLRTDPQNLRAGVESLRGNLIPPPTSKKTHLIEGGHA